jgi:hypothetical protein
MLVKKKQPGFDTPIGTDAKVANSRVDRVNARAGHEPGDAHRASDSFHTACLPIAPDKRNMRLAKPEISTAF